MDNSLLVFLGPVIDKSAQLRVDPSVDTLIQSLLCTGHCAGERRRGASCGACIDWLVVLCGYLTLHSIAVPAVPQVG